MSKSGPKVLLSEYKIMLHFGEDGSMCYGTGPTLKCARDEIKRMSVEEHLDNGLTHIELVRHTVTETAISIFRPKKQVVLAADDLDMDL